MKIQARTQMLSQDTILDSLDIINNLGFDGVEICLERQDWSIYDLNSIPYKDICDRLAELNLAPHSISLHQDYIYDDSLFELTKAAIMMTPSLGTNIFVFSGVKKRTGDQKEWDLMVDRTRILTSIAEDNNVILAKEFEPDFVVGDTESLLRLYNEITSPHLATNLDLGHVFLCDPDPLGSIHQLGEKIIHCHISGMPAGIHDHVLLTEGDLDLLSYLRSLKEVGFKGGMALDLYKYDYEAVAKESIKAFRELIVQL